VPGEKDVESRQETDSAAQGCELHRGRQPDYREGPKGTVTNHLPGGVTLETEDGTLLVKREDDSKAAVHGLVRALVNNAVVGVTTGWTRELEIVASAIAPR